MSLFLDDYDFELPEELIAQAPASPRDSSRLLVLHRSSGRIDHRRFSDLPEYLDSNDLLIANNTRVIKARLSGRRIREDGTEGGKIEFVLLDEKSPLTWEGLFHASARYRVGLRFRVETPDGRGLTGELVRASIDSEHGTVEARFDRDPVESGAGELPLPKYIRRGLALPRDEESYQTVYGSAPGSAAAPTAGLHFTEQVLSRLRQRGVSWHEVTLNVGLGTFRPVKEADIRRHLMHEERYFVPKETAVEVTAARRSGARRIVAVGTTSVRTLESAWEGDLRNGALRAGPGKTSIFIYPGSHEFRVVDRLITNFHLPKSTLLMLVAAFAGREAVLAAYREAVRERYRFFSYGDSMLIL